jgi:hypothetical protein
VTVVRSTATSRAAATVMSAATRASLRSAATRASLRSVTTRVTLRSVTTKAKVTSQALTTAGPKMARVPGDDSRSGTE